MESVTVASEKIRLRARHPFGQVTVPLLTRILTQDSLWVCFCRKQDCKSVHPRTGRGQVRSSREEEDGFLAERQVAGPRTMLLSGGGITTIQTGDYRANKVANYPSPSGLCLGKFKLILASV